MMRKVDIIGIHDKAEDEPFLNTDKRNESPDPCPSTMQSIYVAVPADLKGYLQKRVGETRAHTLKGGRFNSSRSNFRNDVENSEGACIPLDELEDSRSNSASNTSTTSRSKKHRPIACYSIIILQICIFLAMVSTQGFASFTDNPFIGPPTLSINIYGAKNPEKIRHGEIWRALTAIFQSVGILDLFFSSGMLLCFGASVEARWGSIKWLFVYLASGICGNLYSSFLVEPMVVSVGDGGSILGLLGFVHIEMVSSIILSASSPTTKRRDQHDEADERTPRNYYTSTKDGTSSRQQSIKYYSSAPPPHKKRRRTRRKHDVSSAWSFHELLVPPAAVLLHQQQQQQQQEPSKRRSTDPGQKQKQDQDLEDQQHGRDEEQEQRRIDEDKYFLHSAVTAIGMLIGIVVTFTVEWILEHCRQVATHEEEGVYSYYYPSSPTASSNAGSSRHHQYYMKKDWSVLYGGLMTGILCGCIWNICKLNHDMDRRTADRVRLFYGLTLVTIPMLMVGVYSINSSTM